MAKRPVDDDAIEPEDDRPRKRRRVEESEPDAEDYEDRPIRKASNPVSSLIPYTNPKALIGYYMGFISLLPGIGLILGPVAIVLGFLGILTARKNPEAKGMAHAIIAMILGALGFFPCGVFGGLLIFGVLFSGR